MRKFIFIGLFSLFFLNLPFIYGNDEEKKETRNQELLNLISGKAADKSYLVRADAVHLLNDYFTFSEIAFAKDFLYSKEMDLRSIDYNSLKNDVVLILLRQKRPVDELGSWLIEMHLDKEYDATWRDYCIQFLGQIYSESSPSQRKAIISTLKSALLERENGIAGTALIASRNINDFSESDKKLFSNAAVEIALDDNSPDYVKMTAVQIAALNGDVRILDECGKILADHARTYTVQLKMSAMAAIGLLGDRDKLDLLAGYKDSTDIRLSTAAKSAIKKLEYIK